MEGRREKKPFLARALWRQEHCVQTMLASAHHLLPTPSFPGFSQVATQGEGSRAWMASYFEWCPQCQAG